MAFFIDMGQSPRSRLAEQIGLGAGKFLERRSQEQQSQKQQSALAKALGFGDNEQFSQLPLEAQLKVAQLQSAQNLQKQKQQQIQSQDQERYKIIEHNFGKEAADLYQSATEGGKTSLLQSLIESKQRGESLKGKIPKIEGEEVEFEEPIKTKDFDKGLTPKERIKRQDDRYSKNLPLFQNLQQKIEVLDAEQDALNILEDLSPKISAFERLNINPQTGELFIPVLASAEAQRFVKTVNDFTTKAKDSYGARVTNFELDRFLKRLPTLANSEEGRRQIIRQMKIINEINTARETAKRNVIDQYGGIRNVDFDQVEKLADNVSRKQIQELRRQFTESESILDKEESRVIKERKSNVPKGKVAVQRADGTQGYISSDKVKSFLDVKGNKLL